MQSQLADTFGTIINCIDGRAQQPASDWVKLHCNVKYVDVITTPGPENAILNPRTEIHHGIREMVGLSLRKHMSGVVAIAGHFDCLGNPCDEEERLGQIKLAVQAIKKWDLHVRIVGLYVNEWSAVDTITDTDNDYPDLKSYL